MEGLEILPIPILLGVMEIVKQLGVPNKLSPIVALILGVLIAVGANKFAITYDNVMLGIVYGLSASGLYSGFKNTKEYISN